MKHLNFSQLLAVIMFLGIVIFTSCTKEGPAGPDGRDGEDGIDGTNGTATCIQCHDNSQMMFAKVNQWEHSMHAMGETSFENGTSCAPCHTSQGFLERMATDTTATAAAIENPNMVNCYTCHNIHETHTIADWALTYENAVNYWSTGGETVTLDLGKGNICANCHQSRKVNPYPVVGSPDNVTITSYRYGPHNGPVANVIGGFGGYEISGSVAYGSNPHANVADGCVACHMSTAVGNLAGGHTMKIGYEEGGSEELNLAGCATCHSDLDALAGSIEARQTEINDLLIQLLAKLVALGVTNESGYVQGDNGGNASTSNPATLTPNEAGAVLNYKLVASDKSLGIHNLLYAKALLTNSIESLP
jgi:formate-dependent nitrite reductase cytochrome c552 subunit